MPGLLVQRATLRNAVGGDRERLAAALGSVGVPSAGHLWIRSLKVRTPLRRGSDNIAFAAEAAEGIGRHLAAALLESGPGAEPADALFFADEVALAASLIAQWLGGARAQDRAWWGHVTGGRTPPQWWRRAIVPDPWILPRVIDRLAWIGVARPWLAALDEPDVETALRGLTRAYGLSLPLRDSGATSEPCEAGAAASFLPCLDEAFVSGLSERRRLLFGVALLARRRPALLAGPQAARTLAALASLASPRALAPPSAAEPRRAPAASVSPVSPDRQPPSLPPAAAVGWHGPLSVPAVTAPQGAESLLSTPRAAPAVEPPHAVSAPPTPGQATGDDVRPLPARLTGRPGVEPRSAKGTEVRLIASRYSGLLFLLNAFLALRLYGDFTSPRRSALGLSPWGLLRRLGLRWFGRTFERDPLHALLIDLAGGHEADRLEDFDVPPGRCGEFAAPEAALDWDPWFRAFDSFLRIRLAAALGRRSGTVSVPFVCRRRGTLRVSAERVVVVLPLETHPVALRRAGLDRNPGWIPAAGRIVEFAFE